MEKNDVASVLRALATSDESRSETARLRDIFDEVEAAQRAGVSRAKILEALHAQGFTMTLKSFESALYRIRKSRGAKINPSSATVAVAPSSPAPLAPRAEVREEEQQQTGQGDDLAGLSMKERGEKIADKFIKTSNPLLKHVKEKDK